MNWSYPTAIRFGAGRIAEIADACLVAGISKPLLITDRGLAELSMTQATLDHLQAAGLGRALFSDVDPNPNELNLTAGLKCYQHGGHDGVIAFGDGSGRGKILVRRDLGAGRASRRPRGCGVSQRAVRRDA